MHKKIIYVILALFVSLEANSFTRRAKNLSMEDGGGDEATTYSGGGLSGSCSNVPSQARAAFEKASNFSKSCKYGKLKPGKLIAINDYSASKPTMYVFDQSGRCLDSMPIDWGRGPGPKASADRTITSCASGGSHRTPAGMHKTTYHNGKVWKDYNSVGLAGLSGQNSYPGRAVLLHVSRAGNNAGGPYSIGCTGVPANKWKALQKALGHGSLVYNYFGESGRRGAGCGNNAGQDIKCGPAPSVSGDVRGGGRVSMSASDRDVDEDNVEYNGTEGRGSGGRTNRQEGGQ